MFNFFKRKPKLFTLNALRDLDHLHDRVMHRTLVGKTLTKDEWVEECATALWNETGMRSADNCYKKANWLFSYYSKRGHIV